MDFHPRHMIRRQRRRHPALLSFAMMAPVALALMTAMVFFLLGRMHEDE